jgi:hypothetical protein
MTKRNLDSAPERARKQETERNVIQGGQRPPKPPKKHKRTAEQSPVMDWVPPNVPPR